MIKATLFITSILLLHQAWLQTYKAPWLTLPDRANRPNHNRKDLLLSVTPDSLPIDTGSVYWIHVPTDRGLIRAAIATPTGAGPLPTVVILHGTHGFAREYVQIARNGMVGVAACWFAGRRGNGVRFITPIDCPDTPPLADASDVDRFRIARRSIDSLVRRLGTLSCVRASQLVLFGHSLGGGAALDYILTHPDKVRGVTLNSSGYPPEVTKRAAAEIQIPLLLLHGTADSPVDGGSALTVTRMARQLEAAMRVAHKPIEVNYYEGSGHNGIFSDSTQFDDTVHRLVSFVRNHVAK